MIMMVDDEWYRWWMERLAVVGGGMRQEEWKANPDFGMERSGCSTSVESSTTSRVPWISTPKSPSDARENEPKN